MTSRRALILGGTGQIGLATASRLLRDGWDVTVASRGRTPARAPVPEGVAVLAIDRDDDAALRAAATGMDLLVDAVCYTLNQARQLVALGDAVGALSVVSTVSVYADDTGRGFETGGEFPAYPVPVAENQPRVAPGDTGYSDRKVAVEDELLAHARVPVTVTRPGAIYGRGSVAPRELWPYLRAKAGRPYVVLARGGRSRFQPTAAANIAEVIALSAPLPGARVYNTVDPQAPTVAEIVAAVAAAVGHTWVQILLPGAASVTADAVPVEDGAARAADGTAGAAEVEVGSTPWSVPHDVVVDDSLARADLGYAPVVDSYLDEIPDLVAWLDEVLTDAAPRVVFPSMFRDGFDDTAAEDTWLRTLVP